jgi:uncharacterized coiled-coil DUF342 family protein
MDNIENKIICNLQYQLDALKKDNLNYISTISDLENSVSNLKNEIIQKNKEIEKLNDILKLKEEQQTLNKLDSTESVEPNTSIFRKILNFKF